MPRAPRLVAPLLSLLLACQNGTAPSSGSDSQSAEPTFSLAGVPYSGQTLVFPPPQSRRERRALPRELAGAAPDEATRVTWPEIESGGHFEFAGRTLRIELNRRVQMPEDSTALVEISPAIEGKARLVNPWTLTFTAAEPFDPDQTYEVKLGALQDSSGDPIEPWSATFRADPQVVIAGKVISYLPQPGKPRLVTIRPHSGTTVGRQPQIEILYDQPIELEQAKELVALLDSDGKTELEVRVSHPRKDRFDGVEVDRRHVVVLRPAERLEPGDTVIASARDHDQKPEDAERASVRVAQPLQFSTIDCGWRSENCELEGDILHLRGNNFALKFNNPVVDRKKAQAALSITPRVRNLSVWVDTYSSEGRISVSGAFEPSKSYRVLLRPVKDAYGSTLAEPVDFTIETDPLPASASIPTGVQFLDAAGSRSFEVVTRNLDTAKLRIWKVQQSKDAWREATTAAGSRELPSAAPTAEIEIDPAEQRDTDVVTKVDLLAQLEPGETYLMTVDRERVAFDAPEPDYPEWSWASRPPVALVTVNDDKAMLVHAYTTGDTTLVQVSKMTGGTAVSGAKVFLDDTDTGTRTDALGLAVLETPSAEIQQKLLRVEHDGQVSNLPLWTDLTDDRDLTPELSSGTEGTGSSLRAMVMSDRGIYRPGSILHFKAMVRSPDGDALAPVPFAPVRIRVIDPNGKDVFTAPGMTDDMGTIAASWTSEASSAIGRYRAVVEPLLEPHELASTTVQIAEFEPPRFKVDVEASSLDDKSIEATVTGRYLFGAAMDGADVAWSLRRASVRLPTGPLLARGLRFEPDRGSPDWVRTGTGQLDEAGQLVVTQALEVDPRLGPQRFTLEAEVTDQSHRAIAGRGGVTVHPFERYAGIRLDERWPDVGKPLQLELGVVNTAGEAVPEAEITAVLERISWKRTRRPGPGGSTRTQWHEERKVVDRCRVRSEATPVSCELTPEANGTYEVRTEVDGHAGGSVRLWAWGAGWGGDVEPSPGRRVEMVADKSAYEPGDRAKVVVRNPFAKATALMTIEAGGLIRHESREVEAGPVEIEVPIEERFAPHAHATVTLLPIGASGEDLASWKFGAVRLPVTLQGAELQVEVDSDRDHYEPGQEATITVQVAHGGKPVSNADVALAVVDEGVLRLTNFHAPDPVSALRPGTALHYRIADTRRLLAELLERSRVAGDGSGGTNASVVSTRQNFVQTALWRPDLRTDEQGRVSVSLPLPDNLTQFRMMAVVLDADGRGAAQESDFEVRKPLMGIPVVPRFAVAGDRFEAAVMVHNGEAEPTTATVVLGDRKQEVALPPMGRARAAFQLDPHEIGTTELVFSILDAEGIERDRVQARLPVQAPGIDERPRLSGAFTRVQEVVLEVPDGVWADLQDDEAVTVVVGPQTWPELGARLEYLVDYPHGCVEQTTSGTLPLLAARDILPRLGFFKYSREDIDARARAGLERLASMRTSSGGLAYWPGGWEPNVYGTAYAMRAVATAKAQGIALPAGLLEGMSGYLQGKLTEVHGGDASSAEVKASIALALAEAGSLPESSADMLMDTTEQQGIFGLANLALALSPLPDENDRVQDLLDRIEKGFDDQGQLVAEDPKDHYYYYGSNTRTKAQALLALSRLRPTSTLVPLLVRDLVDRDEGYTTQATAFGLLALREHIINTEKVAGELRVTLDGIPLSADETRSAQMGPGSGYYRIPLDDLKGRRKLLRMESSAEIAVSYLVEAEWRRPFEDEGSLMATSAEHGPEVYRVYTSATGEPVDPSAIEPGQTVRVSLLARLPVDTVERNRLGYLAMTDRIPAGFEPIQPDLWTVSRPPELTSAHPFHSMLQWGSSEASHVELRDDRVHLYFDRVWGEYAAGTYLLRATTPGRFVAPPAMAELMYEPDSSGYSTHDTFQIVEAP